MRYNTSFFPFFSFKFQLLILLLLTTVSCLRYPLSEFRYQEVHHYDMVKIGGTKQAILINGKKADNPVLVFLHGGPGFPVLPFAPFTESMKKLEEQYTIVYWEQRGTGRSFSTSITAESMNINQFVDDTHEVINYVRNLLNKDKVFLWGHSWGSNVGALYASRYPENLHAYISTGQSVNPFKNERLGYEFVLDKAKENNNRKALRQLARIDTIPENYTISDALTVRKWVYRYGGIVHKNNLERPYVDFQEIITILSSPLYPLQVRLNLLQNPYFSINKLWEDLKKTDLHKQAPKINVPVYFLVGRHDIIVSHVLAKEYFEVLKAPAGKELVWFEKSAHRPFHEEKEKFLEIMKGRILENAYKGITEH